MTEIERDRVDDETGPPVDGDRGTVLLLVFTTTTLIV